MLDTIAADLAAMKSLRPAKIFLERKIVFRNTVVEQRALPVRVGAN